MKQSKKAFTLIELIVVLVIISILAKNVILDRNQQAKINNIKKFTIEFTNFILSDIYGMNGYKGYITKESGDNCPTPSSTEPFKEFSLQKVKTCVEPLVKIIEVVDDIDVGKNYYYAQEYIKSPLTDADAIKVYCDEVSDTQFMCLIDGSLLGLDERSVLEDSLEYVAKYFDLKVKTDTYYPNATKFTHADADPAEVDDAGTKTDGIVAILFEDVE